MDAPAILYLAGLLFSEVLRLPRRVGRIRSREAWSGGRSSTRLLEALVLASVLLGIWAFPIVYAFTDWLNSFDYSLPAWAVWLGAGIFLISLAVRWKTQRALGGLWSYTVELADKHALVTDGPYSRVRHPLYASLVLWAAAQPLLLSNVIAGWSGAVAVALIWLIRVPREERLMLERFGAEYEQYMARTGRLIPKGRLGGPAG
jgi:protein-S-isoprenylcysteine O-methyltransferase Ste14